jgi:two-component system cell cycle response regulator
VDHFKEINDSMGHGEGDRILVSLARLLRTMTREVDSVCRYGGDEFALLLPETALADAAGKGEALRKAVAEMEFPLSGAGAARRPRVSISVGAAAGRPGLTDEGLLKEADEALYEAKRLGRNRVCFFEPGSQTGARAV